MGLVTRSESITGSEEIEPGDHQIRSGKFWARVFLSGKAKKKIRIYQSIFIRCKGILLLLQRLKQIVSSRIKRSRIADVT